MRPYEGLLTAMVTPFHADGRVNDDASVAIAKHLLANGSHGLVVAGTTGEAATLTDDEQVRLVELIAAEVGGDGAIVAGAGLQRHPARDPAHPARGRRRGRRPCCPSRPTTTSRTAAGIVRHFEEVARAAEGTPVILYNIPARTGVNMPPDLLAELAQIDGIVGLKQANSDELQPIDGLAILAGNDDIYAACLDMGGAGGICVSSHIVGPQMRRMYDEPERARRDRRDAARRLRRRCSSPRARRR